MSQAKHLELIATYFVEVPILEDRPTNDGLGTLAVAVGMRTCKVNLLLDPKAAKALAFKAARNSSQQSVDGALKAVVMEPRK